MSVQTTYDNALALGYEGQLADNGMKDAITLVSAEASAEMPFGVAVAFDESMGALDKEALLPAAITDKVAGILIRSHAYSNAPSGDLGDSGLKPGAVLNVLRKGRVLVACEDGCSKGDRLHIRAVAGMGEQAGALLAAADGMDTIDSTTQGVWLTSAAAGELAVLEVDFTNEP